MKRKSKWKGLLITLVIVAVAAAGGFAAWHVTQNRNIEPVNVFPFQYLGMTEYWGDSQESYGPVTTDAIQTVFLSETQKVTEIFVQQGDTVKKGDRLMTFDTTLSDLALERERLAVEKLKLQLSNAKKELKQIKNMKPMVIPSVSNDPQPEPDKGSALSGDYQISQNKAFDGSAQDKALICWLRGGVSVDDDLLEAIRKTAETYQEANAPAPTDPPVEAPEATEPSTETTDPVGEDTEPSTETTDSAGEDAEPSTSNENNEEEQTKPSTEATEPQQDPTEPSAEPTLPETPPVDLNVNRFYVVMKVTQGDMSLSSPITWQGMEVTKKNGTFSFKFFDASAFSDHSVTKPAVQVPTMPQIDFGSGYTSAQIAQMRAEKEKQIKDIQFQVKMAEADYAIKKTEVESGDVYAQIDGTVVSLLTEDEAKETMQPIMKLSGGGGFYVQGSVSELTKEQLKIGQEVTVNDWNTGMVYTGTIQSVGDFPSPDGYWSGIGNPTASYYPFTVFIDESADLQEGSYVNVVYSTATSQQGIYLENPFLRTENGKTYVYARGVDGKLEKREVTTGKALWGSYTEVLSGITAEDFLAFPYGKNVVEGADTVESDMSALYG